MFHSSVHSKELQNNDEIKEEDVEIAFPKKRFISPEDMTTKTTNY